MQIRFDFVVLSSDVEFLYHVSLKKNGGLISSGVFETSHFFIPYHLLLVKENGRNLIHK